MKALICGVGGQDGAYLAKLLLDKGYDVVGTSRDPASSRANLSRLGVYDRITTTAMVVTDYLSVLQTLRAYKPDEVYNLAAQSSVGLSFEQPVETIESIVKGTLNVLEAIRFSGRSIRLYSAGSSECFGNTGLTPANEMTPFKPRSPYAVAKVAAYNLVANYREAYGLHACTGILFNHESPLRPERFITQKIITTAAKIAAGQDLKLVIGNINIQRDWGWAPEYVEAMWRMLQRDFPEDFVIATGRTVSLEYFIEIAFNFFNLNYRDYLAIDQHFFRPTDIETGFADPSRAKILLDWHARVNVEMTIESLCEAAVGSLNGLRV